MSFDRKKHIIQVAAFVMFRTIWKGLVWLV